MSAPHPLMQPSAALTFEAPRLIRGVSQRFNVGFPDCKSIIAFVGRCAVVLSCLSGMTVAAQIPETPACRYTSAPGTSFESPLPHGYHVAIVRSSDPSATEFACSASVVSEAGALVWNATGFAAAIHDWSGQDIDGDGKADAVLAVDVHTPDVVPGRGTRRAIHL